jgi:hypothetical protein
MGSVPKSAAGPAPVIARVAVGLCAVADLSILGVLVAQDAASSTAAVLAAMAPPTGPLGLLAFGLTVSVILGGIFAVKTMPGPAYGTSLFSRTKLPRLTKAAPAFPLLALSFLLYWCGSNGVSYFAWSLSQPGSAMAVVGAAAALVGAAAFALWMIFVAAGMRPPHSAGNNSSERP